MSDDLKTQSITGTEELTDLLPLLPPTSSSKEHPPPPHPYPCPYKLCSSQSQPRQ